MTTLSVLLEKLSANSKKDSLEITKKKSQDSTIGCVSRLQVLNYMEECWVNVGVLLREI